MKSKLVDFIYEASKESCLSELKVPSKLQAIENIIMQVPEQQYDLESWEYLIFYITDKKIKLQSVTDAKDYIKEWIKQNNK